MDIVADIGGTNIRIASLIEDSLGVVIKTPTPKESSEGLKVIATLARECAGGKEITAFAGGISAEDEKKLSRGALPAIIPLPSHQGSSGYGLARLKRIVERAIGSDILQ